MVLKENELGFDKSIKLEIINTPIANTIGVPIAGQTINDSVIVTTFHDISNWIRLSSLWPLLYGTSCCFIEFACLLGSRFDFDRYGLVPRSSPRQADLIITAGTVTMKMAPSLVRLYEQMPEPKYVIAMGACTITGGMFSTDSYSTVRGVDKLIPVDVFLPGCPPKPEAIIDAIIKLRKKISQENLQDKINVIQKQRIFVIKHGLKSILPIHTGIYQKDILRRTPGTILNSNIPDLPSKENVKNSLQIPILSSIENRLENFENMDINTKIIEKENKDDRFIL